MRPMQSGDKKGYYVLMPDGTYIDIEEQEKTYSVFIRDKEGKEGFKE